MVVSIYSPLRVSVCLMADEIPSYLEIPIGPIDEVHLVAVSLDAGLELRVVAAAQHQAGEQVVEEAEEERLVLVDELAEIHIPQDAHHDGELSVGGIRSLLVSRCAQDG